jgi:phenylacetate-CoA ligase
MSSGIATQLFQHSPVWLQNQAISAYGLLLRRRRYGGEFRHIHAELQASDRYSKAALLELQTRLLRTTVKHALARVPYYRQFNGPGSNNLASMSQQDILAMFPVLTKAALKAAPEQFLAQDSGPTVAIQTSGSTGSPLRVTTTASAVRRNYAFFARFLGWHGVTPFDESATFAGRLFVGPGATSTVQWRRNAAMNDTLFSSYHLTEESIPFYVRELEKRQPAFIDSYPSSIYRIASFLESHGQQHRIRPKVIVTSSETLLDYQRKTIMRVFGCPVRDQYGSAEMAGFFAECEQGRYHVAAEYGSVQVVDSSGTPLPVGEPGQLCLTGFINPAMPLVRYLIGDMARLSADSCACGRSSAIVESIEGRIDDVIVTPSGRHVGRLDPAFKGVTGILESQILQTGHDHIVVRIIAPDRALVDSSTLVDNLTERLGTDVRITIEFVDTIAKEANGKFRAVKSMLHGRQDA